MVEEKEVSVVVEKTKQTVLDRFSHDLDKMLEGWDWKTPVVIQHELSLTQRGFIKTGYTVSEGMTYEDHIKELKRKKENQ